MITKKVEPYPCVINVATDPPDRSTVQSWRYGANWAGYPDLWKHLGMDPFEGGWAGTQLGASMGGSATAGVIFALHQQISISLQSKGEAVEEDP
jgi:hypothetical protein